MTPMHDAPEARHVEHSFSVADGAHDVDRDPVRRRPQRILRNVSRQRRVDEAGLDGDDADALSVESLAQPGSESRHHRLGAAVDIVALPAPVAGHRRDDGERAVALLLELVRDQCHQRHHRQPVGADFLERIGHVDLRASLVGQAAVRDQHRVEPAEPFASLREQRLVVVEPGRIEQPAVDMRRAANAQVVGDRLQLRRVACGKEQSVAAQAPSGARRPRQWRTWRRRSGCVSCRWRRIHDAPPERRTRSVDRHSR